MTSMDALEEAQVRRAVTLSEARRLCLEWGYWCAYGRWGDLGGRKPREAHGGPERRYKAPPQWYPQEPRMPEADEISGVAVQRAFVRLPRLPYRTILVAEYCHRPWTIGLNDGELEVMLARKARVSVGAYQVTLDRALLALANVMRRMGTWREA